MKQSTRQIHITAIKSDGGDDELDSVVIEEPLEIVLSFHRDGALAHQSLCITMRTPGNDFELVRGFLYAEGIIRQQSDILSLAHRGKQALKEGVSNVVQVNLSQHIAVDTERLQRNFTMNSACGVCGKASLEALENAGALPVLRDTFSIRDSDLKCLPQVASKLQDVYKQTGGAHAAAAFDSSGRIICLREDIGRHNAMDKLIGMLSLDQDVDRATMGVFVSGRASFELLQKTAMAGFPFFVAVGAPSSLAVELASEFEITLLGFMRNDGFNIYNRPDRVLNLS